MYKIQELQDFSDKALLEAAKKLGIEVPESFDKETVVYQILDKQALVVTPTTKVTKPKSETKVAKGSAGKKAEASEKEAKTKNEGAKAKKPSNSTVKDANFKKTTKVGTRTKGPAKSSAVAEEEKGKNAAKISKNTSPEEKKAHEAAKNILKELAGAIETTGVLDIMPEKYGILRSADYNFLSSPDDTYVPGNLIRTHNLKQGDTITGKVRPPKEGEKYFALDEITEINYQPPALALQRKDFKHLNAIFPKDRFKLSHKPTGYATRIIELFCPIGFGTRGLIVGEPKDGKSTIMQEIIAGIHHNHPDVYIMQVLIWERPEEASRAKRIGHSEVISCSFDESPKNAIKVLEMCVSKAKRLVEMGVDVFMSLDSLGRVCRAFNAVLPSGRTLSGGVHIEVLQAFKKVFGAARNIEGEGSLTMLATALKGTNNRMDEMMHKEITGTGNSDIVLDRSIAKKNIRPAIDLEQSSTRYGETLLSSQENKFVDMIRTAMGNMNNPEERIKFILDNMKGTATNEEFLASISY